MTQRRKMRPSMLAAMPVLAEETRLAKSRGLAITPPYGKIRTGETWFLCVSKSGVVSRVTVYGLTDEIA